MKPSLQTESTLIDALQARDAAAFSTLYDAYAPTLLGILMQLVKDQPRAEDLLQDAFVKIWATIHRYDPNQGRLFTWLLTITRNLALDELRSRKAQAQVGAYIRERTSDQVYQPTTDGMTQMSVFSLLAPKYRQILELVYAGGFTQKEIADELNLPLGTVKTRFRTAMQELKVFFSEDIYQYRTGHLARLPYLL